MVDAAWHIVQPVLDAWARQPASEFPNYASGSAGPTAADALLALDGGRTWRALTPGRTRPPQRPRPAAEAGAAGQRSPKAAKASPGKAAAKRSATRTAAKRAGASKPAKPTPSTRAPGARRRRGTVE